MGQKTGPNVRFFENGKPLFTVATRVESSIYTSDDYLRAFFKQCESHTRIPRSDQVCLSDYFTSTNSLTLLPHAFFHLRSCARASKRCMR